MEARCCDDLSPSPKSLQENQVKRYYKEVKFVNETEL